MLYSHLLAISIISGAYELVNDRTVAIRFEVVRLLVPARATERAEGAGARGKAFMREACKNIVGVAIN